MALSAFVKSSLQCIPDAPGTAGHNLYNWASRRGTQMHKHWTQTPLEGCFLLQLYPGLMQLLKEARVQIKRGCLQSLKGAPEESAEVKTQRRGKVGVEDPVGPTTFPVGRSWTNVLMVKQVGGHTSSGPLLSSQGGISHTHVSRKASQISISSACYMQGPLFSILEATSVTMS